MIIFWQQDLLLLLFAAAAARYELALTRRPFLLMPCMLSVKLPNTRVVRVV
jgi:hypothetical protein